MPGNYRSRKARLAAVREQLRADGKSWAEIASIIAETEKESPLVAMRLAHGMSQTEVAERLSALYPDEPVVTFKMVSYWEVWPASGHQPSLKTLGRLARLYDCRVSDLVDDRGLAKLSGMAVGPRPERSTPVTLPTPRQTGAPTRGRLAPTPQLGLPVLWANGQLAMGLAEEVADDVLRRTFLLGLSAAGLSSTQQTLHLETVRHDMHRAIDARAGVDLADWHEIVREQGILFSTLTPAEHREILLADLLALDTALARCPNIDARREFYAVGALLTHYMAHAVGDIGPRREGSRWWRTSKSAADASGDLRVQLFVRGREAIRTIYEEQRPEQILSLVAQGDALVGDHDRHEPALLAARAQSLALLGREREAEAALARLRETFAALPTELTNNQGGHYAAYPEQRVRQTESFVYSHLGNERKATQAQETALTLYPSTHLYGPVMIKLQRALCMVRTGDTREGTQQAAATLERLPAPNHTREVRGLGEQVLAAVPAAERGQPSTADLRDVLRTSAARSS